MKNSPSFRRMETRAIFHGVPSRTRTCDILLRRQMLYPAELWAHYKIGMVLECLAVIFLDHLAHSFVWAPHGHQNLQKNRPNAYFEQETRQDARFLPDCLMCTCYDSIDQTVSALLLISRRFFTIGWGAIYSVWQWPWAGGCAAGVWYKWGEGN